MAQMFRFKFELSGLKFEEDKFTKAFDKAAQIMVQKAAREWIRAVILRIGTWTGFAKGSIKFARGPFGYLHEYLNIAIPINKSKEYLQTGRPRFYYGDDGSRVPKTPERGGVRGAYNFPSSQHRWRFSYRSDVVHVIANIFYKNADIPSTSKEAMKAGARAFKACIRANVTDLPRVKDHIKKIKINDRNWQTF